MHEIKYIGPFQAGVIISLVTLLVVAITSLALSIIPMLVAGKAINVTVILHWLYSILAAGAMAFFSTATGCVIYNFVAPKVGGVKIILDR